MTVASIKDLEQVAKRLNEEVYSLRKKVEDARFPTETFKEDDEKVNFYAGPPPFIAVMKLPTCLRDTPSILPKAPFRSFKK